MATFNNYADVQAGLDAFVSQAGVNIDGAPHGAFWQSMSYTDFTTGDIPNVSSGGPWPVLVIGHSDQSNIIQILEGIGAAAKKFGRMPRPRPPYDPEQSETITALAAWIDAKCPNGAAGESDEYSGDGKVSPEETAEVQTTTAPTPAPILEFHVCMGLNSCAQQDVAGTAVMAGTGTCATVNHYCHTQNNCRGQGFCGGGGSTGAQQTEPGNNLCSGQGSCNTLAGPNGTVGPQWYMNQTAPPLPPTGPTDPPPGPYYGQKVWHVARQIFETRMYEQGRTFVPDGKTIPPKTQANSFFGPSPQPDGPNPPPASKT